MNTEQISKLFEQSIAEPGGLVWLADQLLVLAQHAESLSLEDSKPQIVCRIGNDSAVLPASFERLFRPLLARLAKVAADESGAPFQPYGGHYVLRRADDLGPVRLEIEIENAPNHRMLRVRKLVSSERPNRNALPIPATPVPVA